MALIKITRFHLVSDINITYSATNELIQTVPFMPLSSRFNSNLLGVVGALQHLVPGLTLARGYTLSLHLGDTRTHHDRARGELRGGSHPVKGPWISPFCFVMGGMEGEEEGRP